MCYHVIYPVVSMVSEPEKEHAFPMAMEYHLYLRILMRGGLGVLLCLTFPDSMISIVSMVRRSNVLVTFLREPSSSMKKLKEQGDRLIPCVVRNDIPIFGDKIEN